jgi:hypothetical protein
MYSYKFNNQPRNMRNENKWPMNNNEVQYFS